MEAQTELANQPVPPHVPKHLVRDFQFEALPDTEKDSVQAAADAVRGGPDIFYGTSVRLGGGGWVITHHKLIREVYQNAELFSSRGNTNFAALLGESWDLLPLEKDPPEHTIWRTLLNPIFSPTRMKAVEADIKSTAARLVDGALAKGEIEFVGEFAEVFPVTIFLSLFGLPLEETRLFVGWNNGLIHGRTLEERAASARAIADYLRDIIRKRRAAPTDDLISYVVGAKVEGRGVTDEEAFAACFLLYVAGLDTVANMLGFMFKYLAEHPKDQQALRDDPDLIPNAVEELLRAYPIVVSGRVVTRDIDFHGVKMKKGDVVTLPTMLAGRDADEFPDPDRVDFHREKVDHITFAAGPHRCLGSHLARRELRVALEEWLRRVPPFRLKAGEKAVTHAFGVFGVNALPLVWDRP